MLREEAKKRAALKTSIKEGSASNAMLGFGEQYITPAVLALQGSAAHVGVLNAVVGIANPIAQISGSKLLQKYPAKKIVLSNAFWQVICWIIMAAIPLFYLKYPTALPLYGLITIYLLAVVMGGLLHPAYFFWMGRLVRKNERGKYFSKRAAIIGTVGLISIVLGALILDFFKGMNQVFLGFSVLFVIAAIARLISYYYFRKQYEPKEKKKEFLDSSWRKYLSHKTQIGKFAIGMAAFNFALMIASPFFAVYLLQERGYSYIIYTIVIMSSAAWNLVFLPLVGKFSDRYGNASLLTLAGVMFTITPPMWIFLQNPLLIALIPQLLNGVANAAFNIGFSNYIYANVDEKIRASAVAKINILAGTGIVLGSLAGGFILSSFSQYAQIFLIVFLLATIFRGAVSFGFLSKLRDVQSMHRKALQFDIMHPLRSLHHDTHIIKNLLEK